MGLCDLAEVDYQSNTYKQEIHRTNEQIGINKGAPQVAPPRLAMVNLPIFWL